MGNNPKYKHNKSGRIYEVTSMTIINATNKDDGSIMVMYQGGKRDGTVHSQFVREQSEFLEKFTLIEDEESSDNNDLDALIEALTILRKYGNPKYPTHCEHDKLHINISPEGVSDEDIARLHELGVFVDSEFGDEGFASFRFGSS